MFLPTGTVKHGKKTLRRRPISCDSCHLVIVGGARDREHKKMGLRVITLQRDKHACSDKCESIVRKAIEQELADQGEMNRLMGLAVKARPGAGLWKIYDNTVGMSDVEPILFVLSHSASDAISMAQSRLPAELKGKGRTFAIAMSLDEVVF